MPAGHSSSPAGLDEGDSVPPGGPNHRMPVARGIFLNDFWGARWTSTILQLPAAQGQITGCRQTAVLARLAKSILAYPRKYSKSCIWEQKFDPRCRKSCIWDQKFDPKCRKFRVLHLFYADLTGSRASTFIRMFLGK